MLNEILEVSTTIDQPRNLSSVMHKVSEEYGELAKSYNKDHSIFVEEAADTIITIVDAVQQYVKETYGSESGIATDVLLRDAITLKLKKWQAVYGNQSK